MVLHLPQKSEGQGIIPQTIGKITLKEEDMNYKIYVYEFSLNCLFEAEMYLTNTNNMVL